ncbi:MAG: slipin family protein [Deltaproteobacteria bacterium]|nr:slipin family protein [Deltaproteobacteria bacterium]
MSGTFLFGAIFFVWFLSGVRIIMEYQRGVVFRFGRLIKIKTAGLRWIIPLVDRMRKIDLRTVTMDVPPQDVITKDNVSLKVNAVIYFRVVDPDKAVVQVEHYLFATSQLAQTTLRSVLGQHELDQLLAEREQINKRLQEILDRQTDIWGIKVSAVEVKHIDLPEEMKRAMAKQAEAERERRAKVIHADGEFQAAARLGDASDIIGSHPPALHLRYLQALTEIAAEKNSTTIFPVPMDLLDAFMKKVKS